MLELSHGVMRIQLLGYIFSTSDVTSILNCQF